MKMYNEVTWKNFKIKDLFVTIDGSKGLQVPTGSYIKKEKLKNGNIPRITVRDTNNGIDAFYNNDDKLYKTYKNFISVSFLGSVFYHPYEASLDMKVHALILKDKELNIYIAEFLKMMIKKQTTGYSYGNQLSSTDITKITIQLPVTNENNIDYKYMEEFIKSKLSILENKQKEYFNFYYKDLKYDANIKKIDEVEWKEFKLIDLFIPEKGNQNNMASLVNGTIPLVSAKKIDNGYKDFVSKNDKKMFSGNCLTLNNDGDGGAGISYYQPYDMLLDSHVTHLTPKFNNANKYNLLFIAECITKQRSKFGHGYSINNARLNIFKFMLPIDENNNPDYTYMEQYIKNKLVANVYNYINFK